MPPTPFDLHKLGWKAFEDLVACIFREVMGQSFQSFTAGPDGGRDGAFYGTWETQCGDTLSGSFTIQCKHSSKPESNLTDSTIHDELVTIEHLAAEGLADVYIFVTNMRLSGNVENTATRAIQAAGAGTARIYGPRWIDAQISENPRLRRLVPRLYGLGDLTRIMTHQAYRQARSTLEHLAPDLVTFVPTDSYRKCAHALGKYGFVLLLGEPASGKTMIASLLALSAADEWGLQTLLLAGPEDFTRLWNPDDPGQFFWVDDAFGSTQYDPRRAREWNQRLPLLKTAIGKGARAIFTSRDYIFRAAMNDLKTSSFELFQDSRISIQVEHLTELERQQILYNHLKCGKQSIEFRGAVKPWLAQAAVERISDLAIQWYSCEFVEEPINQLLTNEEREALLAELSDVLFSNANDIIHEIKESWDEEEDPSELFSILKTTLDYFEQNETEENQLQVVEFLAEINDAILDMTAEQSESPGFSALDAEKTPTSTELQEVGIFSDIDE